ncbi:hypothetical protein PINS_up022982 [Pythium insidiosum]|nr:hypothetical protein PINS_up022982 [Pythium insidiosum]
MSDNWHLEVKFHGRSIGMVGRLPAEKRNLLREFPKRLALSTKAKLNAGFFCKFVAKHVEEMKVYMIKNECSLCVTFVASTYNLTLYLLAPASLKGLRCLHRLKKSGASAESIQSLCTDREGVVIGFIVAEVNHELEEKLVERQKVMQEIETTAKQMSSRFGDPMLEFELLMDQLETKPSAIPICETMDAFDSPKGKMNVLFLVHDILKASESSSASWSEYPMSRDRRRM